MKVDFIDEDNIIVFLNKKLLENIDINNKSLLEIYFKRLFNRLKNIYDIEIIGYYDIIIYLDNNYGAIVDIEKIDDELYYNQIDMKLSIIDTVFLYEIDDIIDINKFIQNTIIYKYCNKYYLAIDDLDYYNIGKLIEKSKIVFRDTDRIINDGIKIEMM